MDERSKHLTWLHARGPSRQRVVPGFGFPLRFSNLRWLRASRLACCDEKAERSDCRVSLELPGSHVTTGTLRYVFAPGRTLRVNRDVRKANGTVSDGGSTRARKWRARVRNSRHPERGRRPRTRSLPQTSSPAGSQLRLSYVFHSSCFRLLCEQGAFRVLCYQLATERSERFKRVPCQNLLVQGVGRNMLMRSSLP